MKMKIKTIKTKSSATILIAIVAAILIILNLISLNIFSRADLTDNNIYSLSPVSKELVGELNDRLNIKAYITDDLPAPHNNDARYLKDMLDDYRAYSHGYLHYEFIDPVKADREQEVMGYRIPPLQFNVFRNDKTEFIKGYKGAVLLYGDKQELLPFIENTDNLEYDLSRAIKKLSSTRTPTVAFTIGHGEPEMASGLQVAYQLLQQEYRVQFLNLAEQKTMAPDIDVLFVVSPKTPFSAREIYLIDQFLMRGGRAAFLLDKYDIDISQGRATPIDNGLDSLLAFYGIGLRSGLAIDVQCNMIPVMRSMGQYQMQSVVRYPYYLTITNFNSELPLVKDFKSLNMIFVSPLELSYQVPADRNRSILFTCSDESGMQVTPLDISPERKYSQSDFTSVRLPLAAVLSGRFESYFRSRPIPSFIGIDTTDQTPLPPRADTSAEARIIVVGNGFFVLDDNRRNEGSFAFLLNMADWLSQDKGLISIRSKKVGAPVLKETSDGTKTLVKYVNMLAMPLAMVIFGLLRWQFKRSAKKRAAI